MVPAALSYAGSGLLSGFPSSATEGDTVAFTAGLSGDEEGSLEASISPSSGASLSVSGDTIKVSFSEAGSYTVTASTAERTDSCTVTVTAQEPSESEDGSGDDGATGDGDSGDGGSADGDSGDSGDSGSDSPVSGDGDQASGSADRDDRDAAPDDKGGKTGAGERGGASMKGGSGMGSVSGGAAISGGSGSGSASSADKTTYTGSADNYLESLRVSGYEFTQNFNKTNDTYFITVKSGVDSVNVKAAAADENAEVVITGTEDLSTGRNKVLVSVTAENGSVRVYRIYVDVK